MNPYELYNLPQGEDNSQLVYVIKDSVSKLGLSTQKGIGDHVLDLLLEDYLIDLGSAYLAGDEATPVARISLAKSFLYYSFHTISTSGSFAVGYPEKRYLDIAEDILCRNRDYPGAEAVLHGIDDLVNAAGDVVYQFMSAEKNPPGSQEDSPYPYEKDGKLHFSRESINGLWSRLTGNYEAKPYTPFEGKPINNIMGGCFNEVADGHMPPDLGRLLRRAVDDYDTHFDTLAFYLRQKELCGYECMGDVMVPVKGTFEQNEDCLVSICSSALNRMHEIFNSDELDENLSNSEIYVLMEPYAERLSKTMTRLAKQYKWRFGMDTKQRGNIAMIINIFNNTVETLLSDENGNGSDSLEEQ